MWSECWWVGVASWYGGWVHIGVWGEGKRISRTLSLENSSKTIAERRSGIEDILETEFVRGAE